MSSNKVIGKFSEKRGDDSFEVVLDPSGEVVGITQYQNNRFSTQRIDFWLESAPKLVKLIQKAAGIVPVEEYEYNIRVEGRYKNDGIFYDSWCTKELMDDVWEGKSLPGGWVVVKRIKAGPVEDV